MIDGFETTQKILLPVPAIYERFMYRAEKIRGVKEYHQEQGRENTELLTKSFNFFALDLIGGLSTHEETMRGQLWNLSNEIPDAAAAYYCCDGFESETENAAFCEMMNNAPVIDWAYEFSNAVYDAMGDFGIRHTDRRDHVVVMSNDGTRIFDEGIIIADIVRFNPAEIEYASLLDYLVNDMT